MAYFFEVPGRRKISGTNVIVNGLSVTVGLDGTIDDDGIALNVVNNGDNLSIFPDATIDDGKLYKIRVNTDATATRATVTDTIYATGNLAKPPADSFSVEFRFKTQPSHELIVRDVTMEVFGVNFLEYLTGTNPIVSITTFRPDDPSNVFDFISAPGRPVRLRVFAATLSGVERACWLMLPLNNSAKSLMVVISHGFGQNHAYYSNLHYENPLSKKLLEDVRDRFILWRWGRQVAAVTTDMGVIMPVRALGGGSELGPFISQKGIGSGIITRILAKADAISALGTVNVVTFSSGIYDANTFIQIGGKGLNFGKMVNQDPSNGTSIAGGNRRQYLSGWTTGGSRAGFEFMPLPRWANDPKLVEMTSKLGREYLHTWAMPEYTLALALQR